MSLSCEGYGPVSDLGVYRPRRPAETALFRVVRGDLETFLERAREDPEREAVSGHVERTFREYLKCGILAQGFARARCPSCGLDVLVAFSCKKRGVCPSCEGRHRVETAAHLVDEVIPRVPVRHWVLSLPRRVRYFCRHRPAVGSAVLRIFLRAVETRVRQRSPGATRGARFGAVAFEHRGGSFLNPNYHWHVEVTDGVFAASEAGQGEEAEFFEATDLTDADVLEVEALVRRRVLRWLARHDVLDEFAAEEMLSWQHRGGFSLDAGTRIEAWDRHGLERLSRYCARPPFSLQRLVWVDDDTLVYRYPRPAPDGSTELVLSPLEFLARLARLIPPPYRNRVRYFGVLASNARLRKAVVASAGPSAALQAQLEEAAQQMGLCEESEPEDSPASDAASAGAGPAPMALESEKPRPRLPSVALYCWAMLLARIFESLPLQCTRCGAPMKIIAFVTDRDSVRQVLEHIGEPSDPPRVAPARGPPQYELAFDQTVGAPGDEDLDQTRGLPEDHWA